MTRYPKNGKQARWTVAELKAIPPEWNGDTISDGDGLTGEVRVSKDRMVAVRFKSAFKWQGKVAWHQCGTWPGVPIAEIRQRRDQARVLVRQGINPNDHKKAERVEAQARVEAALADADRRRSQDLTFRDMFEAWVSDGVARDDGNAEIRRTFEKDVLPDIGQKPVRLVDDADLLKALRGVGRGRGAGRTAIRMLAEIRQLYRWALTRKPWRALISDGSPAELVDRRQIVNEGYQEGIRERVLSADELRELLAIQASLRREYELLPPGSRRSALRPMKRESELAIWIMLSTMCRVGETLKASWENVDLDKAEWFIPGPDTKTKVPLLVHLSPFALRQFRELHLLTGHSEWCFPSRPTGRTRDGAAPAETHVNEKSVSKQIGDRQVRFMNRPSAFDRRKHDDSLVLSGGANGEWTPHDLRRTGGTMMQALGVPFDVIDRCQNHKLPGSKVRRHYLHHDYADEKRSAWNLLGKHLGDITGLAGTGLQIPATPTDTSNANRPTALET